ncbi:hypothetical protein Y032_0490g2377 [Ancylostoma ceylanicum]|uniref:Uncharacterized protein n=1 Tax=Ancylostoma ceylanicum TaxID=53326 RepID=A0A016WUU1_9BILA|nr:hypothetical protein Y032_0490g2377 [Ancylostoma ceylanicum]
MFGVAPITAKMREARLRWYRHVLRSEDSSVAKSAMNTTVEGRRPRGRPKTRWLDRIEDDMRLLKLVWMTCSIEGNGAVVRGTPTPEHEKQARKKKKGVAT